MSIPYAQALAESQYVWTPKGRKFSPTDTPEDRPADAPTDAELRAEEAGR